MFHPKPGPSEPCRLLAKAVSRWDNEEGADEGGREQPVSGSLQADTPPLVNAELVQLWIRVVALENIMAVLMAQASERQLKLVREMSACILPRPGCTSHRLTIHAASRMVNLAESASHLQNIRLGSELVDKPPACASPIDAREAGAAPLNALSTLPSHSDEQR